MTSSSFLQAVDAAALEEARTFNRGLERLLAAQPSVHTLPVELTRRVRRTGGGIFPAPVFLPEAHDVQIASRGGPLRLRVIRPPNGATPVGAHLYLHGGGWTLGACDLEDPPLAAFAAATGLAVVSVEYRLAPEHPFPAAPDDAEDAARWLLTEGAKSLEVPARFTIGGESAGAHLAALTLIRLRDRPPGDARFSAADMVFGAFDLTNTPSSLRWGDRNLVLSRAIMEFFADGFLRDMPARERRAAEVSPLYADLTGMPPALFTVGMVDPLLDDSLFMAARWRAAGSAAELHVWPEAVHGFTAFPLAIAAAARRASQAFLVAHLRAP